MQDLVLRTRGEKQLPQDFWQSRRRSRTMLHRSPRLPWQRPHLYTTASMAHCHPPTPRDPRKLIGMCCDHG